MLGIAVSVGCSVTVGPAVWMGVAVDVADGATV
jgi:hypothetical protein